MYNDLFTIGNITVHGYGLMIGIGIIAAYLMTEHLAKKKAMDPDPVFSLLIFGVLGGNCRSQDPLTGSLYLMRSSGDPAILWHSLTDVFCLFMAVLSAVFWRDMQCAG